MKPRGFDQASLSPPKAGFGTERDRTCSDPTGTARGSEQHLYPKCPELARETQAHNSSTVDERNAVGAQYPPTRGEGGWAVAGTALRSEHDLDWTTLLCRWQHGEPSLTTLAHLWLDLTRALTTLGHTYSLGGGLMLARERQLHILKKLQMQPAISASRLADELNCSRSTIQRDLRQLDERGEVQRQFGGAMHLQVETIMSSLNESALGTKLDRNAAAKRLIATRALEEINEGDLVFIDSGSTPLYLLPGLAERRVIIVTNSVAAVSRLAGVQAEIYLLGGRYEHKYEATMDAITVREIQDFRFDIAVFGANGVDLKFGETYVSEYQIGEIKRNVLERSKKSILLVDESKFDYTGVCRYAMLADFDKVFVNNVPDGQAVPDNFVVCNSEQRGEI